MALTRFFLMPEKLYNAAFAKMRADFPKCARALSWIEERKESFANYAYMERGFMSFLQATSNPAEQNFKFIKELRGLPIVSMMQAILLKYSSKYVKQLDLAEQINKKLIRAPDIQHSRLKLAPMAIAVLETSLELMRTKQVSFSSISHDEFYATVDLGDDNSSNVFVSKLDDDCLVGFGALVQLCSCSILSCIITCNIWPVVVNLR